MNKKAIKILFEKHADKVGPSVLGLSFFSAIITTIITYLSFNIDPLIILPMVVTYIFIYSSITRIYYICLFNKNQLKYDLMIILIMFCLLFVVPYYFPQIPECAIKNYLLCSFMFTYIIYLISSVAFLTVAIPLYELVETYGKIKNEIKE